MKRSIATLILVALTVAAVASLMMRRARADIVVFTAQLLASNEVPPIGNAEANVSGNVVVTLDTVANTAKFDWSLSGLTTNVILSHIHEGAAGVNGPVRVDSLLSPATPIVPSAGNASFSRGGLTVPSDVRDRILANPAGFYFNVHTLLNTGGVARGQLVRAQDVPQPGASPTLSQWGAIIMTLLILAAGVFFLVGRGRVAAPAGVVETSTMSGQAPSIDWKALLRTVLYVEVATSLILIIVKATPVDALGALTSGLIVAFIAQLLMTVRRR